jgi:hypothetical protein
VTVFYKKVGLDPDARVLISIVPMPTDGGYVETSPDALGRRRRLIFCDFGPPLGERVVDIDRAGPPVRWNTIDEWCRVCKKQPLPIFYDGAADSVPEHLLYAPEGRVVLVRAWRQGPWRPYDAQAREGGVGEGQSLFPVEVHGAEAWRDGLVRTGSEPEVAASGATGEKE